MDGAAKFVRGDAIAGLLITFINLVGGLIIGVGQMGVSFAEAVHSYTLLTVGDGLVSQIPALVVSTAAGLLVAKAGVADAHRPRPVRPAQRPSPGARHHQRPARRARDRCPGCRCCPSCSLAGASGGLAWHLGAARARGGGSRRRGRRSRSGRRGAGQRRARDGSAPARARLRPAAADRRGRRTEAHRSDQGAAPPARRRARLRHAAGAHPGQHPAAGQHLRGQAQGDRDRPRRAASEPAPGHGPQGRPDHAARRGDHRADLRPAGDVDRREPARGGELPRLHRGRPGDRADHASDRDHQGQSGRAVDLRRDPEAARRAVQGLPEADRRSGAQPDQRRRHPARAAGPARRAHLDPRSGADRRGDRRGGRPPARTSS